MLHKNWMELIKPSKMDVNVDNDTNKKGTSQFVEWNLKDCYQPNWILKSEKIITRDQMKQYLPEYVYRCYKGKTWKPHRIAIYAFKLKQKLADSGLNNSKNHI